MTKDEAHEFKSRIIKARAYDEVTELVGDWTGDAELADIVNTIRSRRPRPLLPLGQLDTEPLATPRDRPNPEAPTSCAPLGPSTAARMPQPAIITGSDLLTPSPTPKHASPFGP